MDPRRMTMFREVVRHGSLARAAAELSLTPSPVSQQIAALERQAGVRLLARSRSGLALTMAGTVLLEHAEAITERLALASSQLAALAYEERRVLRIGGFPSALATIVPAAIATLAAEAPDTQFEAVEATTPELHEGVRRGALHLAVCFADARRGIGDPAGLRSYHLSLEDMVVALPPQHRLAQRAGVALTDLADDCGLAPSDDHLTMEACRAAGFEPKLAFKSRDPLVIQALLEAGLCVTAIPRRLAPHFARFALVDIEPDPPRRILYAVLPPAGASALTLAALSALQGAHRCER